MKRKITALIAGVLLAVVSMNGAFAQGSPPWRVVPADLWTCSFNDRQDMGDLDSWVERFNAWADRQEDDTYAAWTLTPSYFGPEQAFDFIWLGAWTDGNAMGEGWDLWNETNGGLMADFLAISSCDVHANFASIAMRLLPDASTPNDGVMVFSDCTLINGATNQAVGNASQQWVQVLDEAGVTSAMYLWYPAFGGGEAAFDFKQVSAFRNYSELGDFYQKYTNGRLFEQRNALLGHLVECDVSRVYNAQNRRFVNVRAEQ